MVKPVEKKSCKSQNLQPFMCNLQMLQPFMCNLQTLQPLILSFATCKHKINPSQHLRSTEF